MSEGRTPGDIAARLCRMFTESGGALGRAEVFRSFGDYGCVGWVGLISPATSDEPRWHCAVRVAEAEATDVRERVNAVVAVVLRQGAKRAAHQRWDT